MEILLAIVLIVVIVVLAWRMVGGQRVIVREGEQQVVLRQGRFHRLLNPGQHRIWSALDQIDHTVNIQEKPYDFPVGLQFLYDLKVSFTLNFWMRTNLQGTASNRQQLVDLAMLNDAERLQQAMEIVRHTVTSCVTEVRNYLRLKTKEEQESIFLQLAPIIPGTPQYEDFLNHLKPQLARALPTVGIEINSDRQVLIKNLGFPDENFHMSQRIAGLREHLPDLSPDAILHFLAANEGKELSYLKQVIVQQRAQAADSSAQPDVLANSSADGKTPASSPPPDAEELQDEDLSVLKRVPRLQRSVA
jgi:hypothetical protein